MTICIAVAVPDGIALAADSQTTWNQTITKAKEKGTGKEIELEKPLNVPISWSKMTRKLFKLTFGEKEDSSFISVLSQKMRLHFSGNAKRKRQKENKEI